MAKTLTLTKEQYIRLCEDIVNNSNAYVKPTTSNSNTSSIGTDISKAKSNNPSAKNFTVDMNNYDSNGNNNNAVLDVDATNPTDAQRKINQTVSSKPEIRSLMNKGQLQANVNMGESVEELRNVSVPFKKGELQEMFKGKK
jgi:hypothetical protein